MQLVVATYERFLLGYRLPTEQQLAEVCAVSLGSVQQAACVLITTSCVISSLSHALRLPPAAPHVTPPHPAGKRRLAQR
jgi:hypothetical protein